jgi:uncharacterized protein (DUF58 family)
MDRQAWRDFFITLFLLGIAFVIALLSSVAAQQRETRLAAAAAAVSLLLAVVGAIYILPRLARKVQLEFIRFAVRTTVTVEGMFFMALLVVIAFAAWNTANNLLYLILSAMLAFIFAANLISRISLADVSVQLRFPDHVFAGEPANLSVTITNHKRLLPTFSLMIEALPEIPSGTTGQEGIDAPENAEDQKNQPEKEASPASPDGTSTPAIVTGLGKLAHFVLVPASASSRQRLERKFDVRGRYPIEAFRISTKFPTGFFKKWRKIEATGEILVYPKPKPLDDFYHALPMLTGQISGHARGSGDDLYGIRRYHPSDHMRHIDWKATAKSRELMVRDHIREDERRLTIVFDTSAPGPNEPAHSRDPNPEEWRRFRQSFERAIEMAASLANHFILEGADVELIAPDESDRVVSDTGLDHLYKILRALATIQPDSPHPAGESAKQRRRAGRRGTANRLPPKEIKEVRARRPGAPPVTNGLARLLEGVPLLADERRFKVLITSAAKGTIPAGVWRSAHVVFMEDL